MEFKTTDMSYCSLHYAVCTFSCLHALATAALCVFDKVDMKRDQIYYLWNFSRLFFISLASITEKVPCDTLL